MPSNKRCLVLIILILCISACANNEPINSPEKLAEAITTSIDNQDSEQFLSLIHPSVREYAGEPNASAWLNASRLDETIKSRLASQPLEIDFIIQDISEHDTYEPDTQSMTVLGVRLKYNTPASKILTLISGDKNLSTDLIAEQGGQWYILLPIYAVRE